MSKAQGFVLFALIVTAVLAIAANPQGTAAGVAGIFNKSNVKATVVGEFLVAWVAAAIFLLVLADAAPTAAGWLAGLILLGAVLYRGPQALSNVGVKVA